MYLNTGNAASTVVRTMFISVQSLLFIHLLVLSPTHGNPVPNKAFVSGLSDDIDSTEMDYNNLKNNGFPSQQYRLRTMSDNNNNKEEVARELVRLLRENRIVQNLPARESSAKRPQDGETRHFPIFSLQNGGSTERDNQKRNLKFNPTGWRKKRSVDDFDELKDLIEKVALEKETTNSRVPARPISLGLTPSEELDLSRSLAIVRRSMTQSRPNPRLDAIIAHLRSLLAKRKGGPLDFNPTGW